MSAPSAFCARTLDSGVSSIAAAVVVRSERRAALRHSQKRAAAPAAPPRRRRSRSPRPRRRRRPSPPPRAAACRRRRARRPRAAARRRPQARASSVGRKRCVASSPRPSSAEGAPREKSWKPPESVISGPAWFMKAWRPPARRTISGPGWTSRWYVLQNVSCVPASRECALVERLQRGVRPDGHEGGRLDHAVRRADPADARARARLARAVHHLEAERARLPRREGRRRRRQLERVGRLRPLLLGRRLRQRRLLLPLAAAAVVVGRALRRLRCSVPVSSRNRSFSASSSARHAAARATATGPP